MYKSGQRKYARFCAVAGLVAVPGTERTLTYSVAHLVKEGLRLRTIKVYLSAVRFWHIAEGREDPFQTRMERLQYMLQGAKEKKRAEGAPQGEAAGYPSHLKEVESSVAEPKPPHVVGSSLPGLLRLPQSGRNDSAKGLSTQPDNPSIEE